MESIKEKITEMVKKSLRSIDCTGRNFTKESEIRVTTKETSDPRKKFNGGDYSFYTVYTPIKKGHGCDMEKSMFDVSYETSSDFSFCKVRGIFTEEETEEDFETITAAELVKVLELHKKEGCNIVHSYFEKNWDKL